MNIKHDLTQLIGNTPLMDLTNYSRQHKLKAQLAVKIEYFNPLGSVKDRTAYAMISSAERSGQIKPHSVIIEPTSGNTGIGLAFVCAAKGYRLILTMPETMSKERRLLLSALGAELILTEGAKGMQGAVDRAEELAQQTPDSFIPSQFDNPANPAIHEATTANEILLDTDGQVDAFVATFGTGGTVSGIGRALKQKDAKIKIFAVEPDESPLVSQGKAGKHGIQGIGANFVPGNFDRSAVDEVLTVTTQDAIETSREVAKSDGLLVGISSGAAIYAAAQLAAKDEYQNKRIIALLPDSGERYLSSGLYE